MSQANGQISINYKNSSLLGKFVIYSFLMVQICVIVLQVSDDVWVEGLRVGDELEVVQNRVLCRVVSNSRGKIILSVTLCITAVLFIPP